MLKRTAIALAIGSVPLSIGLSRVALRLVLLAIDVGVEVVVAVDIDIDLAVTPVASAPGMPPCRADSDTHAK